jgi:hypothetical protein
LQAYQNKHQQNKTRIGGLTPSIKDNTTQIYPQARRAYKDVSPAKIKTIFLVPRLVLGGLVDRENPDKGHNALHKGSNEHKRPSKGPKQAKAVPLLEPPISTF